MKVGEESQESKLLFGGRGLMVALYHEGIRREVNAKSPFKVPTHCIPLQAELFLAFRLSS